MSAASAYLLQDGSPAIWSCRMRRAHGKALPRKQQHFAAAEALRGFEVQAHSEEAPPSALVASWPEAVRSKRVIPLVCNAGLRESGSSFILEVGPQFEPVCVSPCSISLFGLLLHRLEVAGHLRAPSRAEIPASGTCGCQGWVTSSGMVCRDEAVEGKLLWSGSQSPSRDAVGVFSCSHDLGSRMVSLLQSAGCGL